MTQNIVQHIYRQGLSLQGEYDMTNLQLSHADAFHSILLYYLTMCSSVLNGHDILNHYIKFHCNKVKWNNVWMVCTAVSTCHLLINNKSVE